MLFYGAKLMRLISSCHMTRILKLGEYVEHDWRHRLTYIPQRVLSSLKQCDPTVQAMAQDDYETQRPLLAAHDGPEYGTADGPGGPTAQARGTFTRNLGTIEAFAIIASIVIGSGIFTSPGSIDANVPSPGAALVIWLVGGVLAWTGASTCESYLPI